MGSTIMENAVLLRLSFSRMGNTRKGDLAQVATDCDKGRLKLGKVLFVGPSYQAIQKFDTALSEWVMGRAIPCDSGFRGVSILPLALLGAVEEKLSASVEKRAELVADFVAAYPGEVETARVRLNGQFRASDYPEASTVADLFGLAWSYVTFKVPDSLPASVQAREAAKLESRFAEVETEVRDALRLGLADLVGHLVERLGPGEDGKPKVFRDSAVKNLVEFLELFSARNVTRDEELQAIAVKAQAVISGINGNTLRDIRSIRERVKDGLSEVKAAVDGLISSAPRRKFDLGE